MAYIQKRIAGNGTTSYRVQVRLKGCPAESATFDRLTDARQWATKTEADMKAGRYFGEAKRHTFGELLDRYKAWKAGSIKCFEGRKPILDRWLELLGDCQLDAITPAKVAACRDTLAKEAVRGGAAPGKLKSGGTVNRMTAYLSNVMTYAVKEVRWLERNPCLLVSKFKEAPGRVRYLSDAERDALLTACQQSSNPDLYAAVVLSLTTGGRKSEIMGLTWQQVDFGRRLITLRDGETKNNEGRVLPLVGRALDLLKERAKVRR
ncbi:MAG: integrase, partial [Proteobacteria bacterium]|nr:integrase [Pseudomonadota bacterium]